MATATKHAGGRPTKSYEDKLLDGTAKAEDDPHYKDRDKPLSLVKPKLEALPTLKDTKRWIRNAADERAVANGCRFSEELAAYFVEWIVKYLRHSEGTVWAGKPFVPLDWQRDKLFYPLFGWVRLRDDPPFDGLFARRFRRVYCEIPRKNGKSPTAAALGVYMLAGDGEAGARVFSAATDVKQAGIVQLHAIHMIEDAPELIRRCKINRTTRHILYRPTRSAYDVLSSAPRGSWGWNANLINIDELHAWDGDRLYRALRHSGASRPEPIFFQITTAGESKDTICGEQHDYATAVLAGDFEDTSFLPLVYAADPKDDIGDEKVWEKANPSLDHIIPRTDLRETLLEAKQSPGALNSVRRDRFNIWCTSENAFLDRDKWAACFEEYDEADLAGKPCILGLDLSKTIDLTALVALFPSEDEPDVFRQLAWFWLPEDTIEQRKHLAAFQQWVDEGWITPTPGGEICEAEIEEKIAALTKFCKVRTLIYDPWNATGMTQRLEADCGITRVEFRQRADVFAEPTDEYERLVSMAGMRHNGNAVLTWQAGNCTVVEKNRYLRPVKRKRGDYRTVDGIVAAIMALSGCMGQLDDGASSRPELMFV